MIDRIAAVNKMRDLICKHFPDGDFKLLDVEEYMSEASDPMDSKEMLKIVYMLKGQTDDTHLLIKFWEDPKWWSPWIIEYKDKVPPAIKNDPQELLTLKLLLYFYYKATNIIK